VKCILGQGKTSEVFEVKKGNWYCVLKVAKPGYEYAVDHEWEILNALSQNLPKHRHLPEVLWYGPIHFRGNYTSGIITSPIGIAEKVVPTYSEFCMLAQTLFDIHSQGFIHRDITPQNIGFCEIDHRGQSERVPYLRDFGFALQNQKETAYQGTIITASNRVLTSLAQGKSHVAVKKRDDLESLWKSLLLMISNHRPFVPYDCSLAVKAERVLQFWDGVAQHHQSFLDRVYNSSKDGSTYNFGDSIMLLDPLTSTPKSPKKGK